MDRRYNAGGKLNSFGTPKPANACECHKCKKIPWIGTCSSLLAFFDIPYTLLCVCVHASDLPAEMMEKYAAAAGNHSKKSWPHKPTPAFDAMLWWVTTISFSNSTTDSSNLHSSRKRFQLLKEFLLADEMHPSCTKSVSAVRNFPVAVKVGATIPSSCPRRGVQMEGSVEAKLGFEPMKAYWNSMHWMWHVCPCKQEHCLVFFPRKNRTKHDDVYHEISLMDLEIQYGSTEAGRLLRNLYSICKYFTEWCLQSHFSFVFGGNTSRTSRIRRKEGLIPTRRPVIWIYGGNSFLYPRLRLQTRILCKQIVKNALVWRSVWSGIWAL